MTKQTLTAAITIALVLTTIVCIDRTGYTAPQEPQPDAKAISLVRAAFKLINPAKPKTARIHAEGIQSLNNQGLNAQQSMRTQRVSADWKVDFQDRRFLQRSTTYRGKDLMWCTELGVTRKIRYQLFCHSNAFSN